MLSVLTFNVNGCGDRKLAEHAEEWRALFCQHDVVLLQETRSVQQDPLKGLLGETHDVTAFNALEHGGTAGYGLAVYFKRGLQVTPRRMSDYVVWVCVQLGGQQVMVACVYVPLSEIRGQAVWDSLQADVQQYLDSGAQVLVAGDLNAHVGGRDDRPMQLDGMPVAVVCQRAAREGETENEYGTAALDLCQSTGLVLLTGRGAGGAQPQEVSISYAHNGGTSRPDHVLTSLPVATWMVSHAVVECAGSDHLPLSTSIVIPAQGIDRPESQPGSRVLQSLVWDAQQLEEYRRLLREDEQVQVDIAHVLELVESGQLHEAVDALHACVVAGARKAGMRVRAQGNRARGRRFHQPWFDNECKAAKSTYNAHPTAEAHRTLRSLYRRKRRAWQYQQGVRFADRCRQQAGYIWQALERGIAKGFPCVCDMRVLREHFAVKFTGEGVPELPEQGAATDADAEWVMHEDVVRMALQHLNKRAATGIPGVPAHALAVPELREALVALLQAVYRAGREPNNMQEGLLTPVFKRGDLSLAASYRAIVVSSVLHKVYAWCIAFHLRTWVHEQNQQGAGLLSRQCGFLPRRSTVNNMFLLQHAIHHACGRKEPLCVLLLDVASAYDSVDQGCLVDTLTELGVPQHLVRGVHGMYSGLQYSVRDGQGGLGASFPVGVGVKQGCPVSPLLFCMYVHPVSQELESLAGAEAYTLDGTTPLPDWAYADDFMLLAVGAGGLQQLTGAAAGAFLARRLKLEPSKCVVLFVNGGEQQAISMGDQAVPVAAPQGQRYLGLMFDRKACAKRMAQYRGACMMTAFRKARAKVQASDEVPSSIPVMLDLLTTTVQPAGLYGCELWGLLTVPGITTPQFSAQQLFALTSPLEKQRIKILRTWLGLPHSTPQPCLLHELGLEPLVHAYVRRAIRWWNYMVGLKPDSPWRLALQQNVRDAQDARFTVCNFATALERVLRVLLGTSARGISIKIRQLQPWSEQEVEAALKSQYEQHLQSLQGAGTQAGSMISWYFRVVGKHAMGVRPCWYSFHIPHRVMVRFLRFRLGCHFLRHNTGRWERREGEGAVGLPRAQRVCVRCSLPFVDDEDHCLMYCQEVCIRTRREALEAAVRHRHSHPAMNSMAGLFQAVEATGSRELQHKLVHFVAFCYQVAWRCYTDLSEWRASAAVRSYTAQQAMYAYVAQRESTYPWEYDRLSSSIRCTSELEETSGLSDRTDTDSEVTSRPQ